MRSKWRDNPETVKLVKSLLERAGVPLELQVTAICDNFKDKTKRPSKDVQISSERVVYSTSDSPYEYREVDWRLQFYDELIVGDRSGAQLVVSIPIECKYRKDVEFFAFPSTPEPIGKRFPLYSNTYGSGFFASLSKTFASFYNIQGRHVVSVEVRNTETPQKIHEENLAYNAAGALYDFFYSDLTTDDDPISTPYEELIDEMGLFNRFELYLRETHYHWEYVIDRWLKTIPDEECKQFNEHYFRGPRVYDILLYAHMPVVCINGPIYESPRDLQNTFSDFSEIPFCLTSIRKRGWPGVLSDKLMKRSPELPVFITNPDNLESVLALGYEWFLKLRKVVTNTTTQTITRYPLEKAMTAIIISRFRKKEAAKGYRSDYSFE